MTPSIGAATSTVPGLHGVRDRLPVGRAVRPLIEATRAAGRAALATAARPTGCCASSIFALFPYPAPRCGSRCAAAARSTRRTGLQRLLRRSGLLARLPAPLQADGVARAAGSARASSRLPARHAAATGRRRRRAVGLLTGCVQRVFFPRRQRRDGPRAGGRGLRGGRAAAQGCCGALALHAGRRGRGARASPGRSIEIFERAGVDTRRRQRRRLRVDDEGVRRSCSRDDPAWAERAARASPRRCATSPSCWPSSARRGAAAPAAGDASPTTTPATSPTRRASATQPRELLRGDPGRRAARARARPRSAAAAPASTTWSSPEPAARARRAQGRPRCCATGADAHGDGEPGLLDAGRGDAGADGRADAGGPHRSRCSTPPIRGVPVDQFLAAALDGPGTALPRPAARRTGPPRDRAGDDDRKATR